MPIERCPKDADHPFARIDHAALRDKRLSFKATGIIAYLLTKPDHWVIRISDLIGSHTDGRDSIRAAIRELFAAGYLRQDAVENTDGVVVDNQLVLVECAKGRKSPHGRNSPQQDGVKITLGAKITPVSRGENHPMEGRKSPLDRGENRPLVTIDKKRMKETNELSAAADGDRAVAPLLSPSVNGTVGFLGGGGSTAEPDFADVAARKLYDGLSTARKIMRPPNLKNWAGTIRKMLAVSIVTQPEFKTTLRWYLKNLGKPFVPQAFSAEAFVEKFVQIDAAMKRADQPVSGFSTEVDPDFVALLNSVKEFPRG